MNKLRSRFFVLAAILMLAPALPASDQQAAAPHTWNQWRGPSRDGHVDGTRFPDQLDGLSRVWRVPLGKGYPGPIVATDRVFVVETVRDDEVGVRALARQTGDEIWARRWKASGSVPFFARANGGWVRSTPAWDGTTLYVGDMEETLVALDGASGEERWRVRMPSRFGTKIPDFGFASSPLVEGDHVYAQAANSIVKLRAATGETVWRALAGSSEIKSSGAFSSPIIATLAGERQLVVQTRQALYGVKLRTGETLWTQPVPNFRGMNILTPLVHGDTVFTSPYRERSFLYTIRRVEDRYEIAETWTSKATGYMSSPVAIDGHAYLHLGNRRLECVDLATGQARWRSEPFGPYWSMVWQGDRLMALDSDGSLHLVRANPERFELMDSRTISEQETWGHLAVSGPTVFVRELEAISAWSWPAEPSPGPASVGRK